MINFFKKITFLSFFALAILFVLPANTVEACSIVTPPTKIRPQVGTMYLNYSDNLPPTIYLDIQTEDCPPFHTVGISVVDHDTSGDTQPVPQTLILSVQARVIPDGTPLPPAQQNVFYTNQNSFTVPISLGEAGCETSSTAWWAYIGGAAGWAIYNNAYPSPPDCTLWFNISVFDNNNILLDYQTIGGNGSPAIVYRCDMLCNAQFRSTGQYCPIGQTPLDFGTSCTQDSSTQLVSISNINANPGNVIADEFSTEPLAPLPGFTGDPGLGEWLQNFFTFMIVVAGILALITIIRGGIVYATTDAFSKKQDGKTYIINAIVGLILALGAWVILNTINPNLASNLGISIPTATLTIDQAAFVDYESQVQSGQSFVLAGTFENPQTSPGLGAFLDNVNASNKINGITVNTSVPNMTITSENGNSVTIPVTGLGSQGVSEPGQGVEGDRKTPKGDWAITGTRIAQNENDAVTSSIGGFSMGPAFIRTNISTANGSIRGIWIHGNQSNQSGPTMGCVRIRNDDVLALARKINPTIPFVIN